MANGNPPPVVKPPSTKAPAKQGPFTTAVSNLPGIKAFKSPFDSAKDTRQGNYKRKYGFK